MQIIPVIDLKNGVVVHAKQGNRDDYAPIKSEICKTSGIFDVIDAFWTLYHFPTIYIADLNAITRQGNNAELLTDVLAAFPHTSFWIDGGYPLCNARFRQLSNYCPVLGSESFQDGNISGIRKFDSDFILSLDYSVTGELGAKTLFYEQGLWPEHIIIMSLPRVGSNLGPDVERLASYRKQYPQHKLIAAGGIRDSEDLRMLGQIGIQQALVATALHNGRISLDDITKFRTKKYPAGRGIF
jgi:phosphoribosylformimino-5-aminoimidazole carboxamide ribotide isomerase